MLKDYIVYKIYCKDIKIKDEYYGSTSAYRARKCCHKTRCNNVNDKDYNTTKYKIIRSNGGWNNWVMSPIEEIKNCSLINSKIREQYYIDLNKPIMNEIKAYLTEEQTLKRIIEYDNKYRKNNKDKIVEHRENNKEKAKEYRKNNRKKRVEYEKHYRENNKEVLSEKSKEYYNNIKEQKKESFNCICGSTYTSCHKSRHEKTKKHINFINNNLEQCNE